MAALFAASVIAAGFLLRNAGPVSGLLIVALVIGAGVLYIYRVPVRIFLSAQLMSWRNDARQLGLWLTLAFQRNRDARATATMAHQQMFLAGRLLSPMNMFAVAGLVLVGSLILLGLMMWRMERLRAERDALCSGRELSLNHEGQYRTTRRACAQLGTTLIVAARWRDRSTELEREIDRRVAQARHENEVLLNTERSRRARAESSLARQRRRENEAVVSAWGGMPPDLERSVCELAGGTDCGSAGAVDNRSASPAGDLPAGSGGAGDGSNPGPASLDPAAGGTAPGN